MIKEVIKFQINDIEFHLQKCLNCVILLLSLFEFTMKTKFHIWNSALTKFTQDALISFVPLIPHFRIFVRTYNWNHYRRIRVNVISVRLDSWFFFPKRQNLGIWVRKFWKQMFDLKPAPSKQDTSKFSLRLKS